jgi:LysR family transcriptional activator of nhaA
MEWLNYHHLYYFWMAAREGGIGRASRLLNLSQPTVSAQIRTLEEQLGEKLFSRNGGRLELTETGQLAYQYADDIFNLGREFMQTIRGMGASNAESFRVGIADTLPKLMTHRLLAPALDLEPKYRLVCKEDKTERLLSELSIQNLDVALSDAPIGGSMKTKAHNHLLGHSGISFFAAPELASQYSSGFPDSLNKAPFLAPLEGSLLRRSIDYWFEKKELVPNIEAEFQDTALMKIFGMRGAGIFVGPTVLEDEICKDFNVGVVGKTQEISESYYAITLDRKLTHPALVAIAENAKVHFLSKD